MSKETKVRVANAFRAMKSIGISEDKVKPVLKNLLKLYDKNWELIEVENYRTLADAIFEREEEEAAECSKKTMNNEAAEHPKKVVNSEKENCLEEEARATEEPERPLKRLRHRYRDGQTSNSNTSNTSVPRTPLIKPKEEPDKQPESHMLQFNGSQGIEESPQPSAESERVKSQAITCQSHGPNKGKEPTSPVSLMVNERCEPCKPSSIDGIEQTTPFRTEIRSPSHPMRLRDRGKRSVSPQSRDKRSVPESPSDAACPNESNIERDIVLSPKKKSVVGHALIKPKDEPITNDITRPEVPIAVSHPDSSNEGNSSCMNGTIRENEGPEHYASLSVDKIDGTATANELRNNANALCARGLNGSVDMQLDTEVPNTRNGMDGGSHLNKMASGDNGGTNIENQENCAGETNDVRFTAVLQPQVAPETIRSLNDVIDIAKGLEKVVITLVNEVNDESPPSFFYIPQNAVFQNAYLNFSLARMGDNNCCSTCVGDCLSLSTPCACAHETGGEFAYVADGLVKEEFLNECISMNRDPKKHCQFFCKECALERSKNEDVIEPCKGHLVRKFIKECWWKCGCNKQCGNRVVQRGISRNLQVFMTPEGKGWGLRTLEDLPKGAFVCEYVGEVLTNAELFDRVSRGAKGEKHSYPVLLDADWAAEEVLKDDEALCLDATYYGNVARFINHKCYDSNMVEIPVEVETPDHHYYHLAFFTTRKVKAMEELTWDYGIDFDDHDHPIKAFRCQCGSKFCRNIKRSSRSRSSRR